MIKERVLKGESGGDGGTPRKVQRDCSLAGRRAAMEKSSRNTSRRLQIYMVRP